jgi:heptosyltransferase II
VHEERKSPIDASRTLKKFLIIQTAFLGDAVLATALLEKLHASYPDAGMDMVVRKGNEGLFDAHPFLGKLFIWDKRSNKTGRLFRLIRELRRERYDHIINCQRFFSTGLMTVLAKGNETIGYDKNPLSFLFSRKVKHVIPEPGMLRGAQRDSSLEVLHEVDRLNALIEHLTDRSRPMPALYPLDIDRSAAAAWAKDQAYVTIAPASVWFTKQWPAEKWIDVIKILPLDRRVFLIGAPGDRALCDRIAKEAGRGEVLAGSLSLLGTASLMARARMNYVNDSAPLHMASAMNAPVTAVFCSTVAAFGFGPLRANGRVVEALEQLDCRPCGLHGHKTCPKGHFRCSIGIDVARVVRS